MKKLILTALLAGIASTVTGLSQAADNAALIQQGKYLATAGDCQACHRTREDATKLPLSGGYVIQSPMGAIISSNITPSKSHGIGNYTEAQFTRAVRDGIRADGANLYPAMPYTSYRGLSDADMHALYTYFMQGVEPVDEGVPATQLSFPFNQRWLMKGWNLLFLKAEPAAQAPQAPEVQARGRYLVDTLGHCGSCHTPRNVLMAESSQYLAGGSVGGWYAPNITSDKVSGIGAWSEDELVQYLSSGHVQGKGQAGGGMAEAVEHSLRHLSDADLHTMAAYLKNVPPISEPGQSLPRSGITARGGADNLEPLIPRSASDMTNSTSVDGEQLYMGACASCHQPDGKGTGDQFYPALDHNSATGDVRADNLIMAIVQGVDRNTNGYKVSMPAFADQLNDEQIVAVSNYVLQHFGNAKVKVDAQTVAQVRQGGPVPLLIKVTPYLLWLGGLLGVVVIVLLVRWWVRRRQVR